VGSMNSLFPKKCRTCGNTFSNFTQYFCGTLPKGHSYVDCSDVMGKPYTMIYRHCGCGNTLVLSITDETFPELDLFWRMIQDQSDLSGSLIEQVVSNFSEQCETYLRSLLNSEGQNRLAKIREAKDQAIPKDDW